MTVEREQADRIALWLTHHSFEGLKLDWTCPWLTIELHRPSTRNALNGQIIQSLVTLFEFVEAHPEIRATILTGGEQYFCAGADLQEIAKLRSQGPIALIKNNQDYGYLLHRMHLSRAPLIALVSGAALGGGMGLACASDFVLCLQKSLFGMPEPKLGIIAGQIFPYVYRKIGLARIQEMALQGLKIDGKTAEQWGIAHHVYDSYEAMQAGLKHILQNIEACGPKAIENTKKMLNSLNAISDQDIEKTARDVVSATLSPEGIEGTAAFIQKRKPQWHNPVES